MKGVKQKSGKNKRKKRRHETFAILDSSLCVKSFRQTDNSVITGQQSTIGPHRHGLPVL